MVREPLDVPVCVSVEEAEDVAVIVPVAVRDDVPVEVWLDVAEDDAVNSDESTNTMEPTTAKNLKENEIEKKLHSPQQKNSTH